MTIKRIPRIDAPALKQEICPQCKQKSLVDVYEVFGLPSNVWKMCGRCGYQEEV